jgi:hypothetical protein
VHTLSVSVQDIECRVQGQSIRTTRAMPKVPSFFFLFFLFFFLALSHRPARLVHLGLRKRLDDVCSVNKAAARGLGPAERFAALDDTGVADEIGLGHAVESAIAYVTDHPRISRRLSNAKPGYKSPSARDWNRVVPARTRRENRKQWQESTATKGTTTSLTVRSRTTRHAATSARWAGARVLLQTRVGNAAVARSHGAAGILRSRGRRSQGHEAEKSGSDGETHGQCS